MMKRQRQSRKLTVKIVLLIIAAVISMIVMTFLLSYMQTRLYQDSYKEEMRDAFAELPDRIADADEDVTVSHDLYDETYQSLAQSVSYMASHDTGFVETDEKMMEYKELFDVENVLIVKKDGEVVAKAAPTRADYSSSRFNYLRETLETGEPATPVDIEVTSKDWLTRYYAAKLDDETMIVIEQDPTEMHEMVNNNGSAQSILEDMDVGQNGFLFAISALDYQIEYYPDPEIMGTDALQDGGIDVSKLEDGKFSWMNLNGESLFCGVCRLDNTYYIAAVPRSDMTNTRNLTVAVILVAFFLVIFVVIMYGIFAMRDDEREGTSQIRKFGPFYINSNLIAKGAVLAFVGFLAVLLVAFYMQTLFALSSTSVSNNEHVNDIVQSMDDATAEMKYLTDQYGERYLPMCETVGYILDNNSELSNQTDLQEIANILGVHSILVYNSNGKLVATNSSYTNHVLSTDEDDEDYVFIKVLQGIADSVVQEPQIDEVTGDLWQYIGVPLHDENGYVDGLVQVAIRPVLLENVMESADIDDVLDDVSVGKNGFAFAVNKEDDTLAYYPPNQQAVGESAKDHGMTDNEFKKGYNDYITLDGTKYFAASAETEDYYIYLAGTEGELMDERLPLTVVTGIIALLCLVIIFILLVFESNPEKRRGPSLYTGAGEPDEFDTEMPGGRTVKTESAASRWLNRSYKWSERSPWQKTSYILRWLVALLMIVVCVAVLFKDRFFSKGSIFYYILSNDWEYGLNIFAITACIMFICAAVTIVTIVQRLIQLLSTVLGARGQTICRLARSFIKYATIIGMVYYSLLLIGIDGTTLLASAGILSVAISLGARELVTDIISGLFIIFEGDFRVGDIIMVGDWRGTVLEIGVRTTKVEDPGQNVKVIRNSEVSNVINMTKNLSFLSCNFSIEYGESLERVESILAEELPLIPERLPAIVVGPFYRGVTALSDSSVQIRITMQCKEADRLQLERDFNREMKLIFDKHNINIPFPQIVINQPSQFEKASVSDKVRAKEFNKEQKAEATESGEENN